MITSLPYHPSSPPPPTGRFPQFTTQISLAPHNRPFHSRQESALPSWAGSTTSARAGDTTVSTRAVRWPKVRWHQGPVPPPVSSRHHHVHPLTSVGSRCVAGNEALSRK